MKREAGTKRPPSTTKRSTRPTEDPRIARARTAGARASHAWFEALGLTSEQPWYVEIVLDVANRPALETFSDSDTRFHLNIYPEEWGVFFCHGSRASWIRVTDQPFIHGRDDYGLLAVLPALGSIGGLVKSLERRHTILFQREHALVRTNVTTGNPAVRKWVLGF